MNDQERVVFAIREAQLILARHIEPGPCDAEDTINQRLVFHYSVMTVGLTDQNWKRITTCMIQILGT